MRHHAQQVTGGKNRVFGYGLVQAGGSCGVMAVAE
jgi:hypothetical protein